MYKKKIKKQLYSLKNRYKNSLMISGRKRTTENITTKVIKLTTKKSVKAFLSVFQISIINTASVLQIKTQKNLKGKRKKLQEKPSFVSKDYLRLLKSFLLLKSASKKLNMNSFQDAMVISIKKSAEFSKDSIFFEIKTAEQKKALNNKRYLFNLK